MFPTFSLLFLSLKFIGNLVLKLSFLLSTSQQQTWMQIFISIESPRSLVWRHTSWRQMALHFVLFLVLFVDPNLVVLRLHACPPLNPILEKIPFKKKQKFNTA